VRKLVIGIAVVLVVGMVGDVIALGVASKNLRQQVDKNVPHQGATRGRVRSFPFISRFVLFGTIAEAEASVDGVDAGPVHFLNITAKLHGIKVDRRALLHRKARLEDIKSGTVSAEISDTEVSRLIGQTIRFTPGKASLTVHGFTVSANVRMKAGVLTFQVFGLPIPVSLSNLTIPRAPLLPCATEAADVEQGRLRVSCSITNIPKELFNTDILKLAA